MKTPAGTECPYFFGDYFRGRSVEECRLLKAHRQRWSADLCRTCPVPGIVRANACEYMQLRPSVTRPFGAAFQRRVQISTSCDKTHRAGFEPEIGCGECHPFPDVFNPK
jgi:hypothetical protein